MTAKISTAGSVAEENRLKFIRQTELINGIIDIKEENKSILAQKSNNGYADLMANDKVIGS